MENFYQLLGVRQDATAAEIKRAFRERAKRVHPDIAGAAAETEMRRLLSVYETLIHEEKRAAYDRSWFRFSHDHNDFDYRAFLKDRADDPESQARLIFFDLLHMEEEEALEVWRRLGGLDFPLERHLDREDWMDCAFLLAEELDLRGSSYEALILLAALVREEQRKSYFRHFIEDVHALIRDIVRTRLRASADDEAQVEALEELLQMGYGGHDRARWLRHLAESLERLGEKARASEALREALRLDKALPNVTQLRRRLAV